MNAKKWDLNKIKKYNTIGREEKSAVLKVLEGGVLSGFVGNWGGKFLGGAVVKKIETLWAAKLGVRHAISVNSATSGLQAAVGALGLGPGDEIVVSPYTMCASATAPLIYGATPVFADVSKTNYGLDPESLRKRLTRRTRAILVVHLFGGPADMDAIMKIARKHKLFVIEDCAQAPGAVYRGRKVGTIGDIGVFSLNCHKVIQSGEGGLCVTNNDAFALRLQLIRNHAENVIANLPPEIKSKLLPSDRRLVGYNFRMTELEAAIGIEQIKKLDRLNRRQIKKCSLLSKRLQALSCCLSGPSVESNSKHVFYVYPLRYDPAAHSVPRAVFAQALKARGVPVVEGYVKPLYSLDIFGGKPRAACPNVEALYRSELIYLPMTLYDFSLRDIENVAGLFRSVHDNLSRLKSR